MNDLAENTISVSEEFSRDFIKNKLAVEEKFKAEFEKSDDYITGKIRYDWYESRGCFDRLYFYYKKYQNGVANRDNFFDNSMAVFSERKSRPRRKPDYTSYHYDRRTGKTKVSSEYWYTDKGVIRGSGHWGTDIRSCDWICDTFKGKTHLRSTEKRYGFAKWEDFVYKTDFIYDNFAESCYMIGFDNIIQHNGSTYYLFNDTVYETPYSKGGIVYREFEPVCPSRYTYDWLKEYEGNMSLLQEFDTIRKNIGEERYSLLEQFVEAHPQYTLSDVYFKEDVWEESESWLKDKGLISESPNNSCTNDAFADTLEEVSTLKVPGFSYEGNGEPQIIPVPRSRGR